MAALVVTALTAGCIGGLPVGSSVDTAVVEEQVEQRYAALDGYTASVTRTVEVGEATSESRARVTVERDGRRTVAYTAGPRAGETAVESADAGPVFDAGLGASTPATPAAFGALGVALRSEQRHRRARDDHGRPSDSSARTDTEGRWSSGEPHADGLG